MNPCKIDCQRSREEIPKHIGINPVFQTFDLIECFLKFPLNLDYVKKKREIMQNGWILYRHFYGLFLGGGGMNGRTSLRRKLLFRIWSKNKQIQCLTTLSPEKFEQTIFYTTENKFVNKSL